MGTLIDLELHNLICSNGDLEDHLKSWLGLQQHKWHFLTQVGLTQAQVMVTLAPNTLVHFSVQSIG